MQAVITKAWADLRGRLWQSALIAVSVGAAAALLYLSLASLFAASSPYEKQMVRTNSAHAWFYMKDDAAGHAVADRIAARSEVSDSTQRQLAESFLVAPDSETVPGVHVMPLPPGQPRMMGYILLEGRDLQPADQDAALLTVTLARYLRVLPGEPVRLQTAEGPRSLRVAGLIADPKACTFPRCDSQSLYVLPDTFARMVFAADSRRIVLGVRLHEPDAADAFVSRAHAAEKSGVRAAASWLVLSDFYQTDRIFSAVPILLFGVVAAIAAAMILANIIGGAVLGQYREIAVLKSLGFTGGQVLMLYIGQTLCLVLVGGAGGVLAGHLLAVRSMAPLALSMGTPDVLHFMPAVAAIVLAIEISVAVLFAALAAWRAVSLRPAAMLTEGFGAPRARTSLPVRVLAALRLPVPVVLGVGDAMARPARAIMTILSLAVCLLTITQGMNFPGQAASVMQHKEWIGTNWEMTVQPDQFPLAATEDALRKLPGVQGYYRDMFQAATMVEQEFDLSLRTVDGDWDHFDFRVLEGRMTSQPGEIVLAPRAWERLAATVGSKLLMQVGNKRLPVTVVGKYQDVNNNGRMALTTFASLQQLQPDGESQAFLRVKLAPGADWVAVRRSLLERTDYRVLATLEDRQMPDMFREGVAMVRLLGWVMAGIAALSIMGAALLTAREQMREVGIRKAIGMSPAQVLGSVAAGGAWFGLIAGVLAVPLNYGVQKALIGAMAAAMGLGNVPLELPVTIVLRASAVGILLAVAAVLPAAAWGARLVTARVLHAE